MTLETRFGLGGKVAAIVGGGGYLGTALAEGMRECGMTVAILDVNAPAAPGAEYLACDATVQGDLARCRDQLVARHGRVDVLLNAAGVNAPTPPLEITPEEFEQIMRVNVLAVLSACQIFGEAMVAQRRGCIVNFASAASGPPLSKAFVYSAAKAGVVSLTQNLAREWALSGVRVNAVRPGFFPTAWSRQHFMDAERQAKILGHTPMGRFGRPEELVGAVLWLCSEAASFVTGSVVTVDGGFTAMTI